jgi:hypothetical protein
MIKLEHEGGDILKKKNQVKRKGKIWERGKIPEPEP